MAGFPKGTVLDAAGQPITPQRRKAIVEPFLPDLPTAERRISISTVSPAWIRGIVDNASLGKPGQFIDFAEEAREKDDRVGGLTERVEGVVSGLDWQVVPAKVEGQEDRAAEIAADADAYLRRIKYEPSPGTWAGVGGFEDLLCARVSAAYYGWSVQERVWDYVEGGRIEPVRYQFVHPRRFVWGDGTGKDMRIRLYDPGFSGPSGMYPGMELDPLRWTVTRGLVRPGYPMRDGLARTLVWLYAFKSFSWKDLVQFSEQFGSPWILGYLGGAVPEEANWDKDAAAILEKVVAALRGRSRAIISGRDKIEVVRPEGKGNLVPEEIIDLANEAMAVVIVGATQAVSVGEKGTYASATTHEGVELRKVRRYARTVSLSVTYNDIMPWYALNYSDGPELMPSFWIQADEAADLEADLRIDQGLQKMGVRLGLPYLHDHYNRPVPEQDEEIAEPAAAGFPFEDRPQAPVVLSRAPIILGDKPMDVDEGADASVFEGSTSEYWDVAYQAASHARESSLEEAEELLGDIPKDMTPEEFADRVAKQLGPQYSKVIATGKFNPVIEAIYERYKLDTAGWPKGISFDFSGTDLLLQEELAKLDTAYWSKYITQPGSDASVKAFLKDWYGEKGGDLFGRMKKQTIDDFKASMGSKLKQIHDWQAKRIIDSGVVRVRGYAQVRQYHDAGVDQMEVFATSSERLVCAVCRRLNGTRVSVATVYEHMLAEASLKPESWIEHIKERGAVEVGDEAANRALFEETGLQLPVHPHCHCRWRAVFG